MTTISPVRAEIVTDRGRKHEILRKRVGPPRPVEEPKVPHDLQTIQQRREPLIDRLEKLRDNTMLQLSESSRTTIDETIAVLTRLGWREYDT